MSRVLVTPFTLVTLVLALGLVRPTPAGAALGSPIGVGRGSGGTGRTAGGHLGRGVVGPTDLQRQTSVSRTQVTDSPTTHKGGTWWAEFGVVGYSRDASDTLLAESYEFAPVSVGYAFSDRFEMTLGGTAYGMDRVRDLATEVLHTNSGVAGFGLHAKACLVGSDSSAWSLGTAFFATRPARGDTGSAPGFEFGASVPVAIALPGDATLGAMVEGSVRNDPDGAGRHAELVESMAVSRDLAPNVSGYLELVHASSSLVTQAALTAFDAGFDWTVAPHVGLGVGVSLGTSGGHADNGVFGGLSFSR